MKPKFILCLDSINYNFHFPARFRGTFSSSSQLDIAVNMPEGNYRASSPSLNFEQVQHIMSGENVY
jgi:hypothetical protein